MIQKLFSSVYFQMFQLMRLSSRNPIYNSLGIQNFPSKNVSLKFSRNEKQGTIPIERLNTFVTFKMQ